MATSDNTTTHCIYRLFCIPSGKSYVGQTSDFQLRKQSHLALLKNKRHHSDTLQDAFNLFGIDNFSAEVLEQNIPQHLIDEREIYWINQFDSFLNGYNQTLVKANDTSKRTKRPTLILRLNQDNEVLLTTLAQKMGIKKTDVVKMAIRLLAEKEKVR